LVVPGEMIVQAVRLSKERFWKIGDRFVCEGIPQAMLNAAGAAGVEDGIELKLENLPLAFGEREQVAHDLVHNLVAFGLECLAFLGVEGH
jgi:hypothetical protein